MIPVYGTDKETQDFFKTIPSGPQTAPGGIFDEEKKKDSNRPSRMQKYAEAVDKSLKYKEQKKIDAEVKKIVDKGYERARKILTEKIDDLHKISKALLIYETLSGDEIRDLILKNIKPTRSFKQEDEDDGKSSSALGSLGLKPKPAV